MCGRGDSGLKPLNCLVRAHPCHPSTREAEASLRYKVRSCLNSLQELDSTDIDSWDALSFPSCL